MIVHSSEPNGGKSISSKVSNFAVEGSTEE
jgi:hypothetical protein